MACALSRCAISTPAARSRTLRSAKRTIRKPISFPLILQVPNGQREAISIFGDDYPTPDGTCIRDYIHVCDLAQAHILALDYLLAGRENNVFNLGNGVGFSVREVIEEARRVTGHPIPARVEARRAGDPAQLIASSEKAKARARLEAAVQRPAYHHPDRVGLAQGPPAWLRSVRRRGYDR